MTPIKIIKKYYTEGSELYNLLLIHSLSVADKAFEILQMHSEWNIDQSFIFESALIHDIGIFMTNAPEIYCPGEYDYICHGYLGAEIMRKEGFDKHALICERHTGTGLTKKEIEEKKLPIPHTDMLPETIEEKLICFADKFFSKSQPDQIKTVDQIRRSLSKYSADAVQRFDDMVKLFL
jgi:uncharacterized protein